MQVLIRLKDFGVVDDKIFSYMESNGINYTFDDANTSGIDYVIAGVEDYDKPTLDQFNNLVAISRVGVGYDSINLREATKRNITVLLTSDKPSIAVAELCIGNIIYLARKVGYFDQLLKSKEIPTKVPGRDLRELVVGVVGMGSIGKALIKRLKPFEPKVVAYARTWDGDFAERYAVERQDLDTIVSSVDILTLHLPLTDETRLLINRDLLSKIKEDAIIINTSRAAIIDNEFLFKQICDNKIGGVAVDVFEEDGSIEPWNTKLSNVILTPHIGSYTRATRIEMERAAVDNILDFERILKRFGRNSPEMLIFLKKNSAAPTE